MRERREGSADVAYLEALVVASSAEQQGTHELAGGARVDLDGAAPDVACAAYDEGQRASAVVVDADVELAQGVENRAHGTLPRIGIAVERHVAVGQRGDRGDEAHDGPGEPAVDGGRAADGLPA